MRRFVLLFLAACGSQPALPNEGGSADSGVEAATETGASTETLSWSVSATMSRPRNHHMSVVADTKAGKFLWALGGAQSKTAIIDNVDRMPIAADGSLGAAVDDTKLPVPLAGITGGIANNAIVIAGGITSQGASDKSWSAPIKDDGSLGAWIAGGSIGSGRFHAGAFTKGNDVWVMGGFSSVVWDDVVKATVAGDGTLSAWTAAGKLPGPRSHFSVSFVDGYVYIAGGLDQTETNGPVPTLSEVSRARLADDGTLVEWTPQTAFPVGIATHASFVYGGWLYVAGGLVGLKPEKRVWRAPIGADHSLGDWEDAAPLPIARAHVHQLPVVGNRVYSVSGAIDLALDSTDTIDIGVFQ
jgi:hypothetical protein